MIQMIRPASVAVCTVDLSAIPDNDPIRHHVLHHYPVVTRVRNVANLDRGVLLQPLVNLVFQGVDATACEYLYLH